MKVKNSDYGSRIFLGLLDKSQILCARDGDFKTSIHRE